MSKQLLEVVLSKDHRVDREHGVITGVRVLGLESRNGRRYLPEAIRNARDLYEGVKVYFDHPPREMIGSVRGIREQAGWLQNVTVAPDGGLVADFHYFKSDPLTAKIAEAAERRPEQFGFSHNIDGETRSEGGLTIVEKIVDVRSVDLVTDPATTKGLFESEEKPVAKKTVKEILEANQGKDRLAKAWFVILEEDGMDPLGAAAVEVPTDASSDDQVSAAFKSMIMGVLDDPSLKDKLPEKVKKIKDILTAEEKLTAKGEGSGGGSGEGGGTTQESLEQKVLRLEAENESRRILEEAGVKADQLTVDAVVGLGTTAKRKAYVESLKSRQPKGTAEKPRSTPMRETREEQLPTDGKGLAAWLKD